MQACKQTDRQMIADVQTKNNRGRDTDRQAGKQIDSQLQNPKNIYPETCSFLPDTF